MFKYTTEVILLAFILAGSSAYPNSQCADLFVINNIQNAFEPRSSMLKSDIFFAGNLKGEKQGISVSEKSEIYVELGKADSPLTIKILEFEGNYLSSAEEFYYQDTTVNKKLNTVVRTYLNAKESSSLQVTEHVKTGFKEYILKLGKYYGLYTYKFSEHNNISSDNKIKTIDGFTGVMKPIPNVNPKIVKPDLVINVTAFKNDDSYILLTLPIGEGQSKKQELSLRNKYLTDRSELVRTYATRDYGVSLFVTESLVNGSKRVKYRLNLKDPHNLSTAAETVYLMDKNYE